MLMTPLTALAPQSARPGPRMTSMRSTSAITTSCSPQETPPYAGPYTVRPSTNISSLLANCALNPRELTAQSWESIRATSNPGTIRNDSGMVVMPKRRISSDVTMETAAGACSNLVSFLNRVLTETTLTFTNCSMLILARRAEGIFVVLPSAAEAVEELAVKSSAVPAPKMSGSQQLKMFLNESPACKAGPASLPTAFISCFWSYDRTCGRWFQGSKS